MKPKHRPTLFKRQLDYARRLDKGVEPKPTFSLHKAPVDKAIRRFQKRRLNLPKVIKMLKDRDPVKRLLAGRHLASLKPSMLKHVDVATFGLLARSNDRHITENLAESLSRSGKRGEQILLGRCS